MVEPSTPSRLGPYRILEPLGSGGHGAVYRAYDPRLDRHVAVKRILPGRRDAADRRLLLREARLAAGLNHPNLVHVHDILEIESGDWLVMEWVDGRSLADRIEAGGLPLEGALAVAIDVTSGLAAAHAAGVLHHDLKTENVVVSARGRAKILDFGLARTVDSVDPSADGGASIRGTPRAMSPERALGRPAGPASDVFSLGVLLYEALTGRSPFLGPGVAATIARVLEHEQEPIHSVAPTVPRALSDLVDRMLAKAPEQRPRQAADVLAVLREVAESEGAELSSDTAGRRVDSAERRDDAASPPDRGGVDAVAERPEAGFRSTGRRRHLTVTSCCLVPADGVAAIEPEVLFEVLPAFQTMAAETIDRWGGHLLDLRGHRLTVCHGYPRSHEDSVDRAMGLAVELVRAVEASATARGHAVRAKAALHAGLGIEVEQGDRRLIVGPALDRVRRLEDAAPPGAVWLSASTARLVEEIADLTPRGREAVEVGGRLGALARLTTPLSVPMIGRQPELELLASAITAVHSGRGSVFWILGEAGIGKTALLRTWHQRHAEAVRWLVVTALPARSVDLTSLGRQVLAQLVDGAAEDPEGLRRRVAATLDRFGLPELSAPLGLWLDEPPSHEGGADEGRLGADGLEALSSLIAEAAREQPVVVVVDDLHRFASTAWRLVAALGAMSDDLPVLLVAASRPGLDASWTRGLPVTRLSLMPLDEDDSRRLIASIPSPEPRAAAACDLRLGLADGIPGHLVALCREPGDGTTVPIALRDRFAARWDRVGEAADLLRVAAAPEPIDRPALAAVLGLDRDALDRSLDPLISAGILRAGVESGTLVFRLALMRAAVWDSLLPEDQDDIVRRLAVYRNPSLGP